MCSPFLGGRWSARRAPHRDVPPDRPPSLPPGRDDASRRQPGRQHGGRVVVNRPQEAERRGVIVRPCERSGKSRAGTGPTKSSFRRPSTRRPRPLRNRSWMRDPPHWRTSCGALAAPRNAPQRRSRREPKRASEPAKSSAESWSVCVGAVSRRSRAARPPLSGAQLARYLRQASSAGWAETRANAR